MSGVETRSCAQFGLYLIRRAENVSQFLKAERRARSCSSVKGAKVLQVQQLDTRQSSDEVTALLTFGKRREIEMSSGSSWSS